MNITSSRRFEKICVLCSSFPGKDKVFADEAIRVGEVLAKEGIQLIYGGGSMGLMGAVASTAYTKGSQVLGVIPKMYAHLYGPTFGRGIQVWNIPERIAVMYHSADAFIVLPGGLDTLEELACVASWSSLTMHRKPIGFLNVDGYFNNLFSFLDNAVEKGFLFSDGRRIIIDATTIEDLLKKLQAYENYSLKATLQFSGLGKRKRDCDEQGLDLTLKL